MSLFYSAGGWGKELYESEKNGIGVTTMSRNTIHLSGAKTQSGKKKRWLVGDSRSFTVDHASL